MCEILELDFFSIHTKKFSVPTLGEMVGELFTCIILCADMINGM